MSVMQCNVNGCDNVCCQNHLSGYGYICYEHYEQLKEFLMANEISDLSFKTEKFFSRKKKDMAYESRKFVVEKFEAKK